MYTSRIRVLYLNRDLLTAPPHPMLVYHPPSLPLSSFQTPNIAPTLPASQDGIKAPTLTFNRITFRLTVNATPARQGENNSNVPLDQYLDQMQVHLSLPLPSTSQTGLNSRPMAPIRDTGRADDRSVNINEKATSLMISSDQEEERQEEQRVRQPPHGDHVGLGSGSHQLEIHQHVDVNVTDQL